MDPSEINALHASVIGAENPFLSFLSALKPGAAIPLQYRRLSDHASHISLYVADPGTWHRAQSQFEVKIAAVGNQIDVTVTLCDRFASTNFHRLQHIVIIFLDLIVPRRLELIRILKNRLGFTPNEITFIVSYEDLCDEPGVITLSRPLGQRNVLLPDPYYFDSNAYERHRASVILTDRRWNYRSNVAVWRGSTTGSPFDLEDLSRNERIHLTELCAGQPELFDVKITNVVQAMPGEATAVSDILKARGLFGSWMPLDNFVENKFAIHIDGNSSAAGFFEKFCLGCCVLRVASRFEQWFEPRLKPWIHYVPINQDAFDIFDKVTFLRENPILAETIANAGFDFAAKADMSAEADFLVGELAEFILNSSTETQRLV